MLFAPKDNSGQGLVEYALILMLVVLVVILVLTLFGEGLGLTYSNIIESI
jgi:pilus assembly protein Flp/PilA